MLNQFIDFYIHQMSAEGFYRAVFMYYSAWFTEDMVKTNEFSLFMVFII